VDDEYDFRVLKINRRRSNVIVSRRVLLEEKREEKRKELLETLEEDQVIKGKVKNVTEYGVFVDLGGLDGLLHITDMSWKRIKHPKEMVSLGDELELKVLNFDRENQKVSLGMKQLVPDPWQDIEGKYPEGERFTGKVTNLVDYGAFVELEEGVEGLVHISEMSWTRKLRHPSQMVHVGDEIEVVILGVDPDKKRISLGMKQVSPNPWDLVAEKYPEGTILEGQIKNITEFGMFIGIEDGIDGLIHVSDISWTKKIRHPGEIYSVGDTVRAKVLTVDKENEKFTLGIKQLSEDPWTQVPDRYPVGTVVSGVVTNITDFGLFVEVEEGIEGLVHVSEISRKKIKDPSEMFKEGVTIQAKVIHVSADERRLGLSIKQLKEEEEKKTPREFRGGGPAAEAGTNLGELLGRKLGSGEEAPAEEAAAPETEEAPAEEAAAPETEEAPAETADPEVEEAPAEEAPAEEAPEAEASEEAPAEEPPSEESPSEEAAAEEPEPEKEASEEPAEEDAEKE
jgi:small subunit ribosomal protein S1